MVPYFVRVPITTCSTRDLKGEGMGYLLSKGVGEVLVDVELSEQDDDTFYGDHRYTSSASLPFSEVLSRVQKHLHSDSPQGHLYLNQCPLYSKPNRNNTSKQSDLSPLIEDIERPPFLTAEEISSINLWISAGGTRSNFHYDCSHNVLCMIHGTKKILLLDPTYASLLEANPVFLNPPNHCQIRIPKPGEDSQAFEMIKSKVLHVELKAGDMLFIPEGWYHMVESLPPVVIAVNFWWPGFDSLLDLDPITSNCGREAYYLRRLLQQMTRRQMDEEIRSSIQPIEIGKEGNEVEREGDEGQSSDTGRQHLERKRRREEVASESSRSTPRRKLEETDSRGLKDFIGAQRMKTEEEDKTVCRILGGMNVMEMIAELEGLMKEEAEVQKLATFICSLSPIATQIWTQKLEQVDEGMSAEDKEKVAVFTERLYELLASTRKGSLTEILHKKEEFAKNALIHLLHDKCGLKSS